MEVSVLSKITKKEKGAHYVRQFEYMFACPICQSSMKVFESKSLICSNNHAFDFTKQGYVNLLTHPPKTKYSKDLFESRKTIIADDGLFEPLTKTIADFLQTNLQDNPVTILDTGCGEGSHLTNICEQLRSDKKKAVTGAGIDISKEGVFVAAKNYPDMIWTVADLANTPFQNKQFDVILNILSPSNYSEFNRLLKTGGYVMKVVPQSGYLKELREAFFDETDKQSYSNAETVALFKEHFQVMDRLHVRYTKDLESLSIPSLIQMTPLTWTIPGEEIQSFIENNTNKITIDLEILIGKGLT